MLKSSTNKRKRAIKKACQITLAGFFAGVSDARHNIASDAFENRGDTLAATDAHGHQCIAAASALQLVERLGGDEWRRWHLRWPGRCRNRWGLTWRGPERAPESRRRPGPKASLASITSICSIFRPVRASTFCVAGRADAMYAGLTPAWA